MSKLFIIVFWLFVGFTTSNNDGQHEELPHGHWFIDKIFLEYSEPALNFSWLTKNSKQKIHM